MDFPYYTHEMIWYLLLNHRCNILEGSCNNGTSTEVVFVSLFEIYREKVGHNDIPAATWKSWTSMWWCYECLSVKLSLPTLTWGISCDRCTT